MLLTVGEGVDLIYPFDVVIVHHPPVVVVFGALFAEIELFVGAVHLGPSVLAVHALVLVLQELLLVADYKMHLILNLVAALISHHEVVLEGLLITVALQQDRICHAELVLNGAYLPKLQLAQQEGEDLAGSDQGMDVDMSTVEDHLLTGNAVPGCPFCVLRVQVSHM